MPDLGKYATEVLSAYAIALALIFGLVWISIRAFRKSKAKLDAVETRMKKNG